MVYVRLLTGVSESVAVMVSVNLESSGIVWFDIVSSTGGDWVLDGVKTTLSK